MIRFAGLFTCGFASGATRYQDGYAEDGQSHNIVIDLGIDGYRHRTIVDTGSPWSIINPEVVPIVDQSDDNPEVIHMIIRGELVAGQLIRNSVTLYAHQGVSLDIEVTLFVPLLEGGVPWNYPNFIGLSNFLDKLCFAIDPFPGENIFYFGLNVT